MKKWSRWLALALASALALSGCGNSATEEKPTTESEKEPTTAENQTQPEKEESKDASGKHEIKDLVTSQLVVNEMETFNMLYSQSQKEFDVLCNNWDGLLEVDPHGVPIAGIAKDWGTEDGGLTFEIMKGRFCFRLTEPYSEKRRTVASKFARKQNNHLRNHKTERN